MAKKTSATLRKTRETQREQSFNLNGARSLEVITMENTIEVTKEIPVGKGLPKVVSKQVVSSREVSKQEFPLKEVSAKQLTIFRKKEIPSFVLKMDGKLFHTEIPETLSFTSKFLGSHLCAGNSANNCCARLSAASDADGGCAKVRNKASYLELYPWIKLGYETFSTKHDCFAVVNCEHFVLPKPQPKKTIQEIQRLRIGLAQFVWDDVETLEDVNRRRSRALSGTKYVRR